MPEQPSSPDSLPSSDQRPAAASDRVTPSEAHHPADAAHDLSDSDAHARSPEEYTEEPGSHRRAQDDKALDVGG
jgi:hypothetical protein